eukprot:NODE_29_length_37665_cov_1.081563.p35 type:complete len:101 gc:universal NODE_29_length_37665_cov_1.081563:36461-36763(+)
MKYLFMANAIQAAYPESPFSKVSNGSIRNTINESYGSVVHYNKSGAYEEFELSPMATQTEDGLADSLESTIYDDLENDLTYSSSSSIPLSFAYILSMFIQ